MGQRRTNRGPSLRTDREILASPDMEVLRAVAGGRVARSRPSPTAAFMLDDEPIMLSRLAREDLVHAPIGGLPTVLPRGQRLLAVARGELPEPLDD